MAQQKKKRRRKRHDPDRAARAAQREEAKRREREERRLAALAEQKKERRIAVLKRWGRYAVVAAAVTAVALWVFRPTPELEGAVIEPQLETGELVPGATFEYGTSTPTSGGYYKDAQACGVFDEEITAEAAATNVYYGAVVVWYDPETISAAELAGLVVTATAYEDGVAVSPQADLGTPIVATAWRRSMTFDTPEGLTEFVETYRYRAPARNDCPTGA